MPPLTADTALLLLTVGLLLIYLELNRPGLILPGAVGLTLTLFAISHFLRQGNLAAGAAATCLLGFALPLLSTRTRKHLGLGVLATAALLFGFLHLAPAGSRTRPHPAITIPCALFLGAGTSFLTTIAARARQNKGLDLK